jgi:hypothetical protein
MASRSRAALFLALIGLLASAATSEAHTLKASRAAKADKPYAKGLCAAINEKGGGREGGYCAAFRPGSCHRRSSHAVRCSIFLTLEFEDGSQGRCRDLVEWYVRRGSPRLHRRYLGPRECSGFPSEMEQPSS